MNIPGTPVFKNGGYPVPNAAQLAWARRAFSIFVHFGTNTFTGREWGDGKAAPSVFNPANLDARQWARAAKSAGAKGMVLTAKHHDGFCLWPSAFTGYSVKNSPWKGGRGDVVREFVDACRAEGLSPGVYLSPWDRHEPKYGDSPAYNAHYLNQLRELLSNYGELGEIWFDGACGEGAGGKRQVYDWPAFFALCKTLQPNAVTFGDGGTWVRWVGNELGVAAEKNWATTKSDVVRFPGDAGADTGLGAEAAGCVLMDALQHGSPEGDVWCQTEVDVSIRPGWFYHEEEDGAVRSVANLVELYLTSVGRNAPLLLNVPPDRDGRFAEPDVAALAGFGQALRTVFGEDQFADARVKTPEDFARDEGLKAKAIDDHHGTMARSKLEFALPTKRTVSFLKLEEPIEYGQHIAGYNVFVKNAAGRWEWLVSGRTIGLCRIHRLSVPVALDAVRIEFWSAHPGVPGWVSAVSAY